MTRTGMLVISAVESEIDACVRAAASKPFYVYILHRPGVGPFYVGKGIGRRLFCHASEACNTASKNYKLNIIRRIIADGQAVIYELDSFHETEQQAFNRERELIRAIGRYDLRLGPLANMTDGGEGLANPSEETQAKQRACWSGTEGDSDYALVNRFFSQFMPETEAVPIKPADKLTLQPLTPHPQSRSISQRQCAALLASVVAHRLMLAPGCEVPRRLTHDGVEFVIENGVGRDILKSGVATLSPRSVPRDELFQMTAAGYKATLKYFDRPYLESLGVLAPE